MVVSGLVFLGAGLALLASSASALGISLQKLAHRRREIHLSDQVDPELFPVGIAPKYYRQNMWIAGMLMVTLASVLDFIALGLAPQIVVAPTGVITLVFNVFFSRFLLGETILKLEVISTSIMFIGTLVAVIAVRSSDAIRDVAKFEDLVFNAAFVMYSITACALVVYLWKLAMKHKQYKRIESDLYQAHTHRFAISALSGTIGSWNVLFAKSIAEMLLYTWHSGNWDLFTTVWPYLITTGLALSIFFQFKFLNSALKLFNTAYVVPVFQLAWLLGSVISGLIFFQEYRNLSGTRTTFFGLGIICTAFGVWLLTRRCTSDAGLLCKESISSERSDSEIVDPA